MISKKDFKTQASRYLKSTKDGYALIRKAGLYFSYVVLVLTVFCLFAFILSTVNIISKEISFVIFVGTFFVVGIIGGCVGFVVALLFLFLQKRKISASTISTFSKIFNLLSIQTVNGALDIPQDLMDLCVGRHQKLILPTHSFMAGRVQWMNFYIQSEMLSNASFINLDVRLPINGNIIAIPVFEGHDDKKDMPGYYPVEYKGKLFDQLRFYSTKPNQSLDFLTPAFEEKLDAFLENAFLKENGIGTNFMYLKFDANGIDLYVPDGPFEFDFSIERKYKKSGNVVRKNERLFADYGSLESLYKAAVSADLLNQAILKIMY